MAPLFLLFLSGIFHQKWKTSLENNKITEKGLPRYVFSMPFAPNGSVTIGMNVIYQFTYSVKIDLDLRLHHYRYFYFYSWEGILSLILEIRVIAVSV